MTLKIVKYKTEYQSKFEDLNMDWLNKYFTVEPIDIQVLKNPDEYIIKPGGAIYFVCYNNNIIGTAALKKIDNDTIELTKMAVDPLWQGKGAGKFLCKYSINEAQNMGFSKIILYSNKKLGAALNVYNQLGFSEVPLEKGVYQRADIKMEIIFDSNK